MAPRWPDEPNEATGLRGFLQGRMATRVVEGEGLRERKKRLTRQQISDTATMLFLEGGFDTVRVADVAEACGVSEKTVYNYFPTKESLVLDREDDMVAMARRALGPAAPPGSPIEALLAEIVADVDSVYAHVAPRGEGRFGFLHDDAGTRSDGEVDLSLLARFREMIANTPTLRAAQRDMMARIVDVAAEALAARAGMAPSDPEPRIAAVALVGLWHIQFDSMHRVAFEAESPGEARDRVVDELRRAARLIDTGLWSFNLVVQGANTRQQRNVAADAANDARKLVLTAIKAARRAAREAGAAKAEARAKQPEDDG